MFAVIRSGGKQYRVAPEQVLKVEKLELPPAATASQAGFFVNLNAIGKAQLSISYGRTE